MLAIDRILIAGYGSIGRRHLKILRGLFPNADIRLLRHSVSDISIEYANGSFFDISEATAFLPQIAVVANPSPFHLEVASSLIAVGCHLLIEKPISNESARVQSLLDDARAKGVQLQIGYNLRFLSSLCNFREHISEGLVGRVLSVRAEVGQHLASWRSNAHYKDGVSAQKALGGGVLLELSHEIDYLRWIFGEVDWVSCWLGRQSDLEIDVEDIAHLLLGFNHASKTHQIVAQVNLDFIRQDSIRVCTVIGDLGTIQWDGLTGVVRIKHTPNLGWKILPSSSELGENSYELQCIDFVKCVQQKRSPKVTGEDGLAVLNVIDAARKSSQNSGVQVKIF
jgi:predicted dehydrogenase